MLIVENLKHLAILIRYTIISINKQNTQNKDIKMSVILKTYDEVLADLVARFRNRRLELNLTQEGLANRTGISAGAIKHFEKTGRITLDKLLNIAMVLGVMDEFDNLLQPKTQRPADLFVQTRSQKQRKRGKLK